MKIIPIFLMCLLSLSTSCQPEPQVKPEQILHLNVADDPVSFDPRQVRLLRDLTIVKQLFEGLMRLDPSGVPQPAVAESVAISQDGLTYTFHLRSTSWNNHTPVTAEDFENAWKCVLNPQFASDYSYMLYPIKNAQLAREGKCSSEQVAVKALNPYTLEVTLRAPTPYFLELVAFPTYFPVPRAASENFICNGPFCLKEWKTQQTLVLSKNRTYWDQDNVSLDEIQFTIVSDNLTEAYLFEKDKIDWLGQPISNTMTSELAAKLKKEGILNSYAIAGTFWFKFNILQSPFDQVDVRKAFSYALNRHEIIEHILQGNQKPATGPLPLCMALQSRPYFEDGNVQLAREHLEKAFQKCGWDRESFPKVVFNYPPSERNLKIAQYAQQKWKEVLGIEVELLAIENHLYRRNTREGLFQIGTGEWVADFNDPLAFLELFKQRNNLLTGNGMNDTHWYHPLFSALLEEALTVGEDSTRKELLHQAEALLVDEMPIIPLYHYAFDYVKKPFVHNVILSPLGIADFKSTRLEI